MKLQTVITVGTPVRVYPRPGTVLKPRDQGHDRFGEIGVIVEYQPNRNLFPYRVHFQRLVHKINPNFRYEDWFDPGELITISQEEYYQSIINKISSVST